ncbi:hypothetical protein AB0362_13210 [Rhodococcus sp. NPDC079359]|uniref:hypothetical protein n=1 Tax=Rhodococcus sp. NPDC079359 TaxID=3154961 RepID=UPI0034509F1B
MKRTLFVLAAGSLLLTGCSSDTGSEPAPTTETTVRAEPQQTTTTPAAATANPALGVRDPRCVPADPALVSFVQTGFTDSTLTLTNGTAIVHGDLTFVGATTLDGSGEMENRSDVWIVRDSLPYSLSGGARNATEWPNASGTLGISPGDERVQAVDSCVVAITTGR